MQKRKKSSKSTSTKPCRKSKKRKLLPKNILKLKGSPVLKEIAEIALATAAPPPDITLSQWADTYRQLSPESSPFPGQWRTSLAEYAREPMDAISDPDVREVVLMWASQLSKTEIELNTIGYFAHLDPCPMMLVLPDKNIAKEFSKDRIGPMVRDTPVLREVFSDEDYGTTQQETILRKRFKGGFLALVGANNPAALASWPIRLLLIDEADRYGHSAGKEGNPIDLATKRTTAFWNYKRVRVSSPGIEGESVISDAYDESDQREYYVPCPHCQEYQKLEWDNVKFETKPETGDLIPESVHMVCIHCGVWLYEADKHWMIPSGQWVAKYPDRPIRGYKLNALYSPWFRWEQMVREFLEAQHKPEKLKVWVNTRKCETWVEQGERVNDDALKKRKEVYPAQVPNNAFVLTAAADVQKDRIEFKVIGWGEGEEGWIVQHKVLYGDTSLDPVWDALDNELHKDYLHESGVRLGLSCTFIDAGYRTTKVYEFCAEREARRIFAIIGRSGEGRPILGAPSQKKTGRDGLPVSLYPIGVDQTKEIMQARLKLDELGPGYIHFPDWMPDEYFKQLSSEILVTRFVGGNRKRIWKKIRDRNEGWDLLNYCYAGLKKLDPAWESWKAKIIPKKPVETPPPASGTNTGSANVSPGPGRRVRSRGVR